MKLPEWITALSGVPDAMPNGSVSSACACTTAFTSGYFSKIAGMDEALEIERALLVLVRRLPSGPCSTMSSFSISSGASERDRKKFFGLFGLRTLTWP